MPKRLARRFLAQLTSSYALSGLRVLNWAIAAGLVYRYDGEVAFAAFAMARGLVSFMNYAAIGVGPALVTLLPQMRAIPLESQPTVRGGNILEYADPNRQPVTPPDLLMWRTGLVVSVLTLLFVGVLAIAFVPERGGRFWQTAYPLIFTLTAGMGVRMLGDVAGTRLQTQGRITLDNLLQICTEIVWMPLVLLALHRSGGQPAIVRVDDASYWAAVLFALLMTVQLLVRYAVAASGTRRYGLKRFKFSYAKLLLATGGLIVLSQFADFLYAPVNQLLIKANLGTSALAIYAPTLHVDGALLLLVSGLGTLLLPLASLAKSEKRFDTLRSYYVWGTIGSFVMLATGAVVACSIDGWLFTRWLGDPFPATQAILPLVMIHTVVGGTASVGRAVLIGMGRIKAYAISTLIGGGVNVLLAMLLLNYTDLGLFGIIYATIFTVTARCLIWMPIYTLWVIRRGASLDRRA